MNRRSILLLDTEPQTQNHYIALAILDSFRRNPLVDRIFLASYRDAVQIMADEKLDTFVAFGGAERHTDILARLCSMADLSIIWTSEDPYQLRAMLEPRLVSILSSPMKELRLARIRVAPITFRSRRVRYFKTFEFQDPMMNIFMMFYL